jgi:hypothetical protein
MNKVEAVRAILLRDWDPLSVGENPNLTDEYDAYIPGLLRLIDQGCACEQLERYLLDIERGLHLRPDASSVALAAKNILAVVIRGG